jgi:tetratricopeptide (TPR) repeat protein
MKKPYKNKLSLCMIVKNEAHNLRDCIEPLKPVLDEIIVVDTGSTDGTREVAKSLGAKVFDFTWCDDFSAARNESLRHATGDYILWLDADDRVDNGEVKKIGNLKENFPSPKNKAYFLIIRSISSIDGETRFLQLRIFPNLLGVKFEGRIHEQVSHILRKLRVELVNTDIAIIHKGYSNPESIAHKSKRNLRILQKEIESDPENPIFNYHLGRTFFLLGENDQAISHMKKVYENCGVRIREKQFFLDCSLLLGELYTASKRYEEALSVYKDIERDYEKNALIRIRLGEALFYLGQFHEAIRELESSFANEFAVGLLPLNIEWNEYYRLYILSLCYKKIGNVEKAKILFSQMQEKSCKHYKNLEKLGFLLLSQGEFEEALKFYIKIVENRGDSDEIYTNIGLCLKKIGQASEAEKVLMKALALNPKRMEALVNLGYIYYEQKEFLKAEETFTKALSIDSNLDDVRLTLSEIYFRQLNLESLVDQCAALLKRLNLKFKLTINNFKDISFLFEEIGNEYNRRRAFYLSLMAYHVSFLISPSNRIMELLFKEASRIHKVENIINKIKEAVYFHNENMQIKNFSSVI